MTSRLSVIIPSKTASNFEACAMAVRHCEPDARIILVDDGLGVYPEPLDYQIVIGEKPFVFSRNCNRGIREAGTDDCVLLNDDAILQSHGGFSLLQHAAEQNSEFGVIAATANNVGNHRQFPNNVGLRDDPRMVCFIAVLIPRRTIDVVGLLDERFGGPGCYGHEDDDYCYRVRLAGLRIGIHDGCFVDHASLPSTFRGNPLRPADLHKGRDLFIDKWGSYPL